ncbi:MAG TPA: hypothetical protein VIL72_13005 [Beijerinckiaceae bacterium]
MKSFSAILDDTLRDLPLGATGDARLAAGVFLPEGATPPHGSSAALRAQAVYAELMEDEAAETEEDPPEAEAPDRVEDPDPTADLLALAPQVASARSLRELAALRRAFARRNHPDLAPPAFEAACAQAMREANALIDAAARRLG